MDYLKAAWFWDLYEVHEYRYSKLFFSMSDIKSVTQMYPFAFQPDELGFAGAAREHDPVPSSVHVTAGQAGDSGPGQ